MSDQLPVGPYKRIALVDGGEAPYYIIPFDKRGRCDGPLTRAHLIEAVRDGNFTDLFVFCHGWNNDWTVATERYEKFLGGYVKMRQDRALPIDRPFRPLLVGVFWPSTALVFGERERGPEIAGTEDGPDDVAIGERRREITETAETLAPDDVERFYELVQKDSLGKDEALELARMARGLYGADDELGETDAPEPEDMVELWREVAAPEALDAPPAFDDFGIADDAGRAGGPAAAGFLERFDPRRIVRVFTVYRMKDRAGTVGATGVRALVDALLGAGDAKMHLIGHSYGAKVLLSAVAGKPALSREVRSMLLLQPAVSHLAFAAQVPSRDRPGGYRSVLERVELPILTTFSKHDRPLTKFFHRALRREADLGEAQIAASGEPPDRYAALGGFGPRGAGEQLIGMHRIGERYALEGGVAIVGLRGDDFIEDHGDISNEGTWWALYNLVTA